MSIFKNIRLLKWIVVICLLFIPIDVLWSTDILIGNLSGHYETMTFSVWAPTDKQARVIAKKSEKYYETLLKKLKYGGMLKKKCQIYIYSDKNSYIRTLERYGFNNLEWTAGVHFKRGYSYPSVVCSFESDNVLTETLPHELTHAIFKEFVLGIKMDKQIPLWINEGIAVYMQEKSNYKTESKRAIKNNEYIKLKKLISLEHYPQSPKKNMYFYAQSASLVDFLLKKYQGSKFLSLSRKITFTDKHPEEILISVYYSKIRSIEHLEKLWIDYVKSAC